MLDTKEIQLAILEAVKQQLPNDSKTDAEKLAPYLNLNKNAVYKRLSGQTQLSLEDLVTLAQQFDIPLEKIFYPNKPSFEVVFSGFDAKTSSFEYLSNLEADLSQLVSLTDPKIWYVSIGLPDFYFFLFDEMTLFQVFTWERLTWNNPDWQSRKFTLDMPDKNDFLKQTKRLANYYTQLQVTEYWSEYVLDNFFQQLHYVVESKLYEKKEDILSLLRCSRDLIGHLRKMAMTERRFAPLASPSSNAAPFHLFYNETMKNNIMLLIETKEVEMVYAVVDNPNFVKTTDPKMIAHVRKMFEKLEKRAIPLGNRGERFRDVFFEKLEKRHGDFEEKILGILK